MTEMLVLLPVPAPALPPILVRERQGDTEPGQLRSPGGFCLRRMSARGDDAELVLIR